MNKQGNETKPVWELEKPILLSSWDFDSVQRFFVIKSVSIDLLLKCLDSQYESRFTKEGLSNPRLSQKKVEKILERWSNELAVDPPNLLWNGQSWMIENGIHRTNCAIALGESFVPIIVLSHEFQHLVQIL